MTSPLAGNNNIVTAKPSRDRGLLTCSYKRGAQNPNLEPNKIRKANTMMRPTVEVETSHRLFSAPRGDTVVGSGLKRWAIQVKKCLTV